MEPITREEMFLAAADGDGTAPTPITRKERFLAAIAKNGGGVSSWNDLTDKPFGVEGNAHFDGDLTGREVLPIGENMNLVKISDKVLAEEECVGAELRYMILHDSSTHSMTITENLIVDATANFGISCFIMGEPLYLQNGVPMVGVIRERGTVQGLEVSAGTYYLTIDSSIDETENMYVSYFSALETVKKLDIKYLPIDEIKAALGI